MGKRDALLATECRGIVEAAAKLTHRRVRKYVVQRLIASGISQSIAGASDERVERAAVVAWLTEALQTDEGRRRLPSLYTHAAIHSQIRWMRNQQLRDNDLADHHQVAQAIAHCDALLVDRGTRNVLVSVQIRLDRLYRAAVMVTPQELFKYLQTVAPAT
jgi:hypothetical protein